MVQNSDGIDPSGLPSSIELSIVSTVLSAELISCTKFGTATTGVYSAWLSERTWSGSVARDMLSFREEDT